MANMYNTVLEIYATKTPTEPLADGLLRYDLGSDGLSMIYNPTDQPGMLAYPAVGLRPGDALIVKFGEACVYAIIRSGDERGFWITPAELAPILANFVES